MTESELKVYKAEIDLMVAKMELDKEMVDKMVEDYLLTAQKKYLKEYLRSLF